MKITIEHFDGKYPSFNVALASSEGKDAFLVVKGCRVVDGPKGRFVSGPSRKLESGKYWNHTYFSDDFSTAVLKAHDEQKPAPKTHGQMRNEQRGGSDEPPF